jgi:hypothetical protein
MTASQNTSEIHRLLRISINNRYFVKSYMRHVGGLLHAKYHTFGSRYLRCKSKTVKFECREHRSTTQASPQISRSELMNVPDLGIRRFVVRAVHSQSLRQKRRTTMRFPFHRDVRSNRLEVFATKQFRTDSTVSRPLFEDLRLRTLKWTQKCIRPCTSPLHVQLSMART